MHGFKHESDCLHDQCGKYRAIRQTAGAGNRAVGMGQTGTQVDVVRKKNAIPQQIPLFTLQGNFDIEKLHGMYRFMMQMMVKFAGKGLSNKQNRTPEEDDMLDMMLHGGNRVCIENLQAVLDWYKN